MGTSPLATRANGGLARPVAAEQRDALALLDGHAQPVQRLVGAVGGVDLVERRARSHRGPEPGRHDLGVAHDVGEGPCGDDLSPVHRHDALCDRLDRRRGRARRGGSRARSRLAPSRSPRPAGCPPVTSSPEDGSSVSSRSGRVTSARASSTVRRSPRLSAVAGASATASSPQSLQRLGAPRELDRRSRAVPESVASGTLAVLVGLHGDEQVVEHRQATEQLHQLERAAESQSRAGVGPARQRPTLEEHPAAEGMSSSPAIIRNSVVLPAPFAPMSPTASPTATSSDTSCTAAFAPKRLEACSTASSAVTWPPRPPRARGTSPRRHRVRGARRADGAGARRPSARSSRPCAAPTRRSPRGATRT